MRRWGLRPWLSWRSRARKARNGAALRAAVLVLVAAGVPAVAVAHHDSQRVLPPPGADALPLESEARPDQPDEAARYRLLRLTGGAGDEVPAGAFARADRQLDAMAVAQAQAPAAAATGGAGLARANWSWLGPGNVGGRIRALVVDPRNLQTIWIGGVAGGIWKSVDGGGSWKPEDDFMANLAVSTLVISPADSNVLYAGTGESFVSSGLRGNGVFKSVDGGTSWTQLPSTAGADWLYVNRLAIDPRDARVLLAATSTGLFRSVDAGVSWTRVLSSVVADVQVDANGNAVASAYADAWSSRDGGVTWTAASGLPGGRTEVAFAPSAPGTVYASVAANGGEIWRSTDFGRTYALRSTGANYLASQGWYGNALWVSPTDANLVVVGGIDLFRSRDGGVTLTKISDWTRAPRSAHADHHVIVAEPGFDGGAHSAVYFGNDGGIYKAGDIGTVSELEGWTSLDNGLGITQFYDVAVGPISGTIFGGTQDNGTIKRGDDTDAWDSRTIVWSGDGGTVEGSGSVLFGEYTYLDLHRTTDEGRTAEYISGVTFDGKSWKPDPYSIPDVREPRNALFIAPFAVDPANANRLFAGGASLWRTNDALAPVTQTTGPAWTSVKPPLGAGKISAVTFTPTAVYVGYVDGELYRSSPGIAAGADATGGAQDWTRIDQPSARMPVRTVNRIVVDSQAGDTVYVAYAGFSSDNLWRSPNGGRGPWGEVSGTGTTGLPDVSVYTVAVAPGKPGWLYAGTEAGVFASADGGATWHLPTDGPARVPVTELLWDGNRLVAATYGRGVFEATIDGVVAVPTPPKSVAATAHDGAATVNWSPPATDGGSAIAGYVVTPYREGEAGAPTTVGAVTTAEVGGLTNGASYTFKVAARNAVGTGRRSAASAPVVPVAPPPPPPGGGGGVGGRGGGGPSVPDLAVQVVPASATIEPNGVDDVSVFVTNHGGAGSLQTTLTIALPGTMSLLGSPGFERGSGCTGATTLTCYLDYVPNASQTKVWFSVRVGAALGEQTITASVTADRDANTADNTAAAVVTVRQAQPGGDTGGKTAPRGSNLSVRTGTARADVLRGTAGRDRLDGRGGNDVLWGLGGVDILLGGAGNDRLIGGAGKDQLLGGAGNDRLEARDHARDVVNCGPGKDTAVVDRVDVVRGCELVRRLA
jgi:Fibronectin type III domain/RTX calcium-binding nonapeptide repeat (4 copies)/Domain of unknown function DUF11